MSVPLAAQARCRRGPRRLVLLPQNVVGGDSEPQSILFALRVTASSLEERSARGGDNRLRQCWPIRADTWPCRPPRFAGRGPARRRPGHRLVLRGSGDSRRRGSVRSRPPTGAASWPGHSRRRVTSIRRVWSARYRLSRAIATPRLIGRAIRRRATSLAYTDNRTPQVDRIVPAALGPPLPRRTHVDGRIRLVRDVPDSGHRPGDRGSPNRLRPTSAGRPHSPRAPHT